MHTNQTSTLLIFGLAFIALGVLLSSVLLKILVASSALVTNIWLVAGEFCNVYM